MTAAPSSLAAAIAAGAWQDSRPRNAQVHLVNGAPSAQLFMVEGSRLYQVDADARQRLGAVLDQGDDAALAALLSQWGLDQQPAVKEAEPEAPPVRALSLAVAQKCNLGCTYCYAQQGDFGGAARSMPLDVALRSVDLLFSSVAPGKKLNLAFLGGEPLQNRAVLRQATEYAHAQAQRRGVELALSITTNGTLLTPDDAAFFEAHGFAVTVSLDGMRQAHNQLRPFKNGAGSFDLVMRRVDPLLALQRRMQVSVRTTVTPSNLDLPGTLEHFVQMGFHSVGFSPLLHAVGGAGELDAAGLERMLEGMVACGLLFEQNALRGQRMPFLNMVNGLRELHRGSQRPYPCGAGVGYFGVSAEGTLSACHRFVGDEMPDFGHVSTGVDRPRQALWLQQRHVHRQTPCGTCWARYLCAGGCHHEVLARGRTACDFIRGWLHYLLQAYGRLQALVPALFEETAAADGALA